jgi:hypothetical protein
MGPPRAPLGALMESSDGEGIAMARRGRIVRKKEVDSMVIFIGGSSLVNFGFCLIDFMG